jgi:predicted MFS family arabinose efflux permease
LLGIIFAGSGAGFLLGAVLTNRTAQYFPAGTIIIGAAVIGSLATLVVPLASGPTWFVVSTLTAALLLRGLALMHFDLNVLTMRQSLTPDHFLGRVTATTRLAVRGVAPIGALLGGFLGELIGLQATLLVAALGGLLSVLWLWFSPLNTIKQRRDLVGTISDDPAQGVVDHARSNAAPAMIRAASA